METESKTVAPLTELLEFCKSQKIDFLEYGGRLYSVNSYKYKKYYTIYDQNDFYINEVDSLEALQRFLQANNIYNVSSMITQHSLIQDKYYIYRIYELIK